MNEVTELMLPLEGAMQKVRVWIDVTEFTEDQNAMALIRKREIFVTAHTSGYLHEVNTFRVFKVLKDTLKALAYVNAFEVTNKQGHGFVHYFNWP